MALGQCVLKYGPQISSISPWTLSEMQILRPTPDLLIQGL